jgi:hypothetical protein
VLQPAGIASGGNYQLQSGFWYGTVGVTVPPSRWLYLPVLLRNFTTY